MTAAFLALTVSLFAQDGLTLSANELTDLRQKVSEKLRDPRSAYFRNVEIRTKGQYEYVCGWVSGRNGMGGMGQPTRFFTIGPVVTLMDGPSTIQMWERECGENGESTLVRQVDWNPN